MKSTDNKPNHSSSPSTMRSVLSRIPIHPPAAIPLDPPAVNSQMVKQPWFVRSSETIQYTVRRLEYALSPSGRLRQWLKLNLLIAVVLAVPLLLFLPLLAFAFGQISDISLSIQQCIARLQQALVPALILLGVLSLIVARFRK